MSIIEQEVVGRNLNVRGNTSPQNSAAIQRGTPAPPVAHVRGQTPFGQPFPGQQPGVSALGHGQKPTEDFRILPIEEDFHILPYPRILPAPSKDPRILPAPSEAPRRAWTMLPQHDEAIRRLGDPRRAWTRLPQHDAIPGLQNLFQQFANLGAVQPPARQGGSPVVPGGAQQFSILRPQAAQQQQQQRRPLDSRDRRRLARRQRRAERAGRLGGAGGGSPAVSSGSTGGSTGGSLDGGGGSFNFASLLRSLGF